MVVNNKEKQKWKKTKLLIQLEYSKQAIQRANYKKVSSDQEWNCVDFPWVNKQNERIFFY